MGEAFPTFCLLLRSFFPAYAILGFGQADLNIFIKICTVIPYLVTTCFMEYARLHQIGSVPVSSLLAPSCIHREPCIHQSHRHDCKFSRIFVNIFLNLAFFVESFVPVLISLVSLENKQIPLDDQQWRLRCVYAWLLQSFKPKRKVLGIRALFLAPNINDNIIVPQSGSIPLHEYYTTI